MTTSATQDFLSEIVKGEPIPSGKLAYFRARLSGRIHQSMLKIFGALELQKNFTRRDLARRIGRKPEQITRWFSYPGNLTLDTVSDIFVGMGCELEEIVLVDLATGARIQFPERRTAARQTTAVTEENPPTGKSNIVEMQLYKEEREILRTAQDYQEPKPSPHGRTAESNQMNSTLRTVRSKDGIA